MKFPKERVVMANKIKELLASNNHFAIAQMKDEILENAHTLDDYCFNNLIASTFVIGDFDQVVVIFSELFKEKIETYTLLYYGLLGLLANCDIYAAISYINKSELLNQNDISEYFIKDGANYSNILYLSNIDENATLVLVLVNFIKGISREIIGNIDLDNEYILFRFFDLINMLYEIGYSQEIIEKLTFALKTIFNLEI